ncbi:MAG: YfhO family protein [Chloroflexi bacterium]|nr:YfhO family protein [Chloroflexota bacterium]
MNDGKKVIPMLRNKKTRLTHLDRITSIVQRYPIQVACVFMLMAALLFMHKVLFPSSGMALAGHDIRSNFHLWFTFMQDALKAGELPLWDTTVFSGYPFMSNPQVAFFYLPSWLVLALPVNVGISWHVLLHLVIAGVGMFLFVRDVSKTWVGGMLAGLTFAFSGYTAVRIWAGHIGFIATSAWLPWLLWAMVWSVRKKSMWAGLLAGVPLAGAVLAGNSASLINVTAVWFLFTLYWAWQSERWQLVLRQFLLAGVMGAALASVQLIPVLEFTSLSTRVLDGSFEFSTSYSLPPAHLITFLVPGFFGEPIETGYWSLPVFEELIYYVGLLPLIGLVFALRKPSRLIWFYVGLMALGLLLALGKYTFFYEMAFNLFPFMRLARAPGRWAFLFVFAGTALLGELIAVWSKADTQKKESLGQVARWLGSVLFVTGVVVLASIGAQFLAQHPSDTSGRLWHQVGGWGLFLLVGLAGVWLFWRFLSAEHGKTQFFAAAGLIIIVLVDLWGFGFNLLQLGSTAVSAPWADAAALIGETDSRILPWGISIFDQNDSGPVDMQSVFGYNPLEVGANTAFTSLVPDPRSTAYDILSAGYVIANSPQDQFVAGERPLIFLNSSDNVWVYQRSRVLPVARLINHVELIADVDAALARVHAPDFDPEMTAIVAEDPGCEVGGDAERGTAVIQQQRSGYWQIATNSQTSSLLVLAETAYPGWRVTIDDQPADWVTAYTTIRAVCVPAGEHVVEWTFQPTSFIVGSVISLLAMLVCLFAWRKIRRSYMLL